MNILKRTLAGLLVVFLAFGQVTVIPGDWVQGFSSLTTAGSNVYVTGLGTIGQDTSFTRSAAGRYTLYDATPTTGVTTQTIRAGAGQSTTSIISFQIAAGNQRGRIYSPDAATYTAEFYDFVTVNQGVAVNDASAAGQVNFGSGGSMRWSSTSVYGGTKDLGLTRSSANNLGITNGSSTTYATIGADGIILNNGRFQIPTSTPASASATCTTGTITWDTNFTYVCVATDTWKRAAIATW